MSEFYLCAHKFLIKQNFCKNVNQAVVFHDSKRIKRVNKINKKALPKGEKSVSYQYW
jgi:hypothetical protein